MKIKLMIMALVSAALLTSLAFVSSTQKIKIEQINTNNFHLLDFVGWNTSFRVMEHYHATDVKVFGAGYVTVGMKDHAKMLMDFAKKMPVSQIIHHFPTVAKGEWTGCVGTMVGNINVATVAKWKNERIVEEYLFMVQLSAAEAAKMKNSVTPMVSFENYDDKQLADAVDLRAGWKCVMDEVKGKRTAYFFKTVNGKEVQRLIFQ